MDNKESFIMYKSHIDVIKELPSDAEKIEMLYAIADYSMTGEIPEFKSITCKLIFMSIRPNLDGADRRYRASVENGKKGGAPKGTTPWNKGKKKSEPKANPSEPSSNQVEPNANLYVYDDVYEYEDEDVSVSSSVSSSENNSFVSWKEVEEYLKDNNLEYPYGVKNLWDNLNFQKGSLEKQLQIIKDNCKPLQLN